MGKLRFGSGGVTVEMSDDFSVLIRRAMDDALPGVYDRLEQAVDRVYTQAVERAPVDTGTFRASIKKELVVSPDYSMIRGRVMSDLDYARYIRSPAKLPGTGSAFVELFRKPMDAEGDALIADVGDVLRRAME